MWNQKHVEPAQDCQMAVHQTRAVVFRNACYQLAVWEMPIWKQKLIKLKLVLDLPVPKL